MLLCFTGLVAVADVAEGLISLEQVVLGTV
jgi:hypothetical protein